MAPKLKKGGRVSMSAAALHCCISEVAFSRLLNLGVIERQSRDVGYDLDECRAARFKYLENIAAGRGGEDGGLTLTKERSEMVAAQRQGILIKNAIAMGEVVSIKAVRREVEAEYVVTRERLLTIPGKIATLCEMRAAAEIELVMRDEIKEVLNELSDPATRDWGGGAARGVTPSEEGPPPAA